jgi:hypothetical protein
MALTKVIGSGLGAVTQDGAATFNEAGADVDFRVESDTLTHALFVDGANGNVGIGTSSPQELLTIYNGASGGLLAFQNNTTGTGANGSYVALNGNDLQISNRESANMIFYTADTERMRVDATGAVTMPSQPAFMGKVATQITNFAVGSAIAVPFSSEIFDQNLDYNTNGTFTAPITGKYQFNILILISNMDSAASYYQIQFITSNRAYYHTQDARGFDIDIGYKNMDIAMLADMDVGDTAIVKIIQATGTQQSDLDAESYFTGFLAC